MDMAIQSTIAAIHASPTRAVIYLAGGASQAVGWLLSVPRASETILEVSVPYSRISMMQLLGKTPVKFVSKETAEDIATVAYNRSLKLSLPGTSVVGIGFTGTLASAKPKKGDHRCHVCARTLTHVWNYQFTFTKGLRNRENEDFVASQILIKHKSSSSAPGGLLFSVHSASSTMLVCHQLSLINKPLAVLAAHCPLSVLAFFPSAFFSSATERGVWIQFLIMVMLVKDGSGVKKPRHVTIDNHQSSGMEGGNAGLVGARKNTDGARFGWYCSVWQGSWGRGRTSVA